MHRELPHYSFRFGDVEHAIFLCPVVFRRRKANSKTRAAALTIFTRKCTSMRFNNGAGNG